LINCQSTTMGDGHNDCFWSLTDVISDHLHIGTCIRQVEDCIIILRS